MYSSTKGLKASLEHEEIIYRQGKPWILETIVQQIIILRQTFKMKSKSWGTLYFIKDFTFKDNKTFKING